VWLVSESPAAMWGFFKPIIMKREKTGGLIDTGYMSHLDIPLPLKPRSPISPKIGEMLTSLDTTPKQILRQQHAGPINKKVNKKTKEYKKKRKQYLLNKKIKQNEKERIKQLLQIRVKKD
jgi:hypothetical protein